MTVAPAVPAAGEIVTVPVVVAPPAIDDGLTENPVSVYGLTVRLADWDVPFATAVIAMTWDDVTGEVVTANVVIVAPAGTVAVAGTEATEELALDSVTTTPDGPAAPDNVTVPLTGVCDPPVTVDGVRVSDWTPGA